MKLDILYLIFVGYFIELSEENGHGKHVHVKIHVPYHVHKHNHKHTVYKKVPVHVGGHEKKHVVIHKHNHKHKHDHGHKHGHNHKHKHGHKHHGHHDHKHKHLVEKHHGHGHHYEAEPHHAGYALDPLSYDDDGYTSSRKSVRSEHYEVEQKNPTAPLPELQHVVRGSYKVQETDPHDFTTTSYQAYDSPAGKKIAQALVNFDGYGGHQDLVREDYVEGESEEQGEEDEGGEEDGHYEDYGDGVEQYTAGSDHGAPGDVDEGYNYGTEQVERYILRKVYGSDIGSH